MSIGFYLQKYTDKRGRRQLYVRLRLNGVDWSHSTEFKFQPEHWDSRNVRVKSTEPFAKQYNKKLADIKENVFSSYDALKAGIISFEDFKVRIEGSKAEGGLKGLISLYETEKTPYTYRTYLSVVNTFKNAIGKEPDWTDISYTTISKAITYWKAKGTSATSINSYVKQLGTLKNDAYNRGITKEPFIRHKKYTQKVQTTILESIDKDKMFKAVMSCKTEREFNALLMYLLMFMLRGMYAQDIASMKPEKGMFTHFRHKTGERMVMYGLSGVVLSVFKTLSGVEVTRTLQKEIKASLSVPFKTARKTYDTYAVLIGIDIQIRFNLLGQKERSIKKHYTNFEWDLLQDKVFEAHKRVLNEFELHKQLFHLYKTMGKEIPQPIAKYMFNGGYPSA